MLNALPQFIPIQSGQSSFIKEQGLISNLLGAVGYELKGEYVVFTEDITAALVITSVDFQLLVMDLDHYADHDILPINPDMAAAVVQEVALLLMQTPQTDKKVDSTIEETRK